MPVALAGVPQWRLARTIDAVSIGAGNDEQCQHIGAALAAHGLVARRCAVRVGCVDVGAGRNEHAEQRGTRRIGARRAAQRRFCIDVDARRKRSASGSHVAALPAAQ